jgi:hypothetical protein
VKLPAASCGASKRKVLLGAAAPKPPLAIPPPSKLGGILASPVIQLLLDPLFPLSALFTQDRFAHFPQSFTGMRPIHDLHCVREVQFRDPLNPRRPVVDRTETLAVVYAASQSFAILIECHRIRIPQSGLIAVALQANHRVWLAATTAVP